MTDNIPTLPPAAAKARAQDVELLEQDVRRALTADRPASDALWSALLKPRDVVLREYVASITRVGGTETAPVMLELMTPDGRPMGEGPSALHAMANTLVAKAILGDQQSAHLVMTRIEGVPAKRKGDEDSDKERAGLLADVMDLVERMYDRTGEHARVINGDARPGNGDANGHDPHD